MYLDDLFRSGRRHFFDIYPTRCRGDHDRFFRSAIVGDRKIDLMLDGRCFVHQHLADRQALDVHRQDLTGKLSGFMGILGDLYAPCLAAPPDQYLRFNNNAATQFLGDMFRLFCGSRYPPLGDWNSIFRKNGFRLVLMKFHVSSLVVQMFEHGDYTTRYFGP